MILLDQRRIYKLVRNLASIQKIESLSPIEDADRIETATVLGWEVVVGKGQHKVGDKVVYIEVDSILPDIAAFEFMRARKFRVKTIKLKKQISQGLIASLNELNIYIKTAIGTDITDIIGIKKYDPELLAENMLIETRKLNRLERFMMRYSWFRKLINVKTKGTFPSFISKTDEIRIQSSPSILTRYKELFFDVTEKIDGQSGTFFLKKNKKYRWWNKMYQPKYNFGVCSRNLQLHKPDNSSYWRIAKKYDIEGVLNNIIQNFTTPVDLIVLQGEIAGPGIQGNKYKLSEIDLFSFNLKYDNLKLNYVDMNDVLFDYKIKSVPLIGTYTKLPETVTEIVERSKGFSKLNPTVKREGEVNRNIKSYGGSYVGMKNDRSFMIAGLNMQDVSFKCINPEFLLKFED